MNHAKITRAVTGKAALEIKGYAAIFDVRDLASDVIVKGAFEQSLSKLPAQHIKMLYHHDPKKPIGIWHEVFKDDVGLYVRGEITDYEYSPLAKNMIADSAMDGLSIGFRALDYEPTTGGGRRLKSIDLREVSLVRLPMQPEARLTKADKEILAKYKPQGEVK